MRQIACSDPRQVLQRQFLRVTLARFGGGLPDLVNVDLRGHAESYRLPHGYRVSRPVKDVEYSTESSGRDGVAPRAVALGRRSWCEARLPLWWFRGKGDGRYPTARRHSPWGCA